MKVWSLLILMQKAHWIQKNVVISAVGAMQSKSINIPSDWYYTLCCNCWSISILAAKQFNCISLNACYWSGYIQKRSWCTLIWVTKNVKCWSYCIFSRFCRQRLTKKVLPSIILFHFFINFLLYECFKRSDVMLI